jgi:cell division septal protein FtsQ
LQLPEKSKPTKIQEAMMKLFRALICMMMIAFFLVAGTAFQGNQALAAGKEPKQVEIFGTVQSTPNGFVIMSEGKTYRIEGQDLSKMKGKMVTVKGTVTEENGKRVVNVTSAAEK